MTPQAGSRVHGSFEKAQSITWLVRFAGRPTRIARPEGRCRSHLLAAKDALPRGCEVAHARSRVRCPAHRHRPAAGRAPSPATCPAAGCRAASRCRLVGERRAAHRHESVGQRLGVDGDRTSCPGRGRAAPRGSRPRTAQRARGPLAPTTRRSPRPEGRRGNGARTSEIVATRNPERGGRYRARHRRGHNLGAHHPVHVGARAGAGRAPSGTRLSAESSGSATPQPAAPGERRRPGPSGLPVRAPGRIAGLEGQKPPEQPHHADLPGDGEQEDHRPPSRDGGCNIVAGQHEQGVRR